MRSRLLVAGSRFPASATRGTSLQLWGPEIPSRQGAFNLRAISMPEDPPREHSIPEYHCLLVLSLQCWSPLGFLMLSVSSPLNCDMASPPPIYLLRSAVGPISYWHNGSFKIMAASRVFWAVLVSPSEVCRPIFSMVLGNFRICIFRTSVYHQKTNSLRIIVRILFSDDQSC